MHDCYFTPEIHVSGWTAQEIKFKLILPIPNASEPHLSCKESVSNCSTFWFVHQLCTKNLLACSLSGVLLSRVLSYSKLIWVYLSNRKRIFDVAPTLKMERNLKSRFCWMRPDSSGQICQRNETSIEMNAKKQMDENV